MSPRTSARQRRDCSTRTASLILPASRSRSVKQQLTRKSASRSRPVHSRAITHIEQLSNGAEFEFVCGGYPSEDKTLYLILMPISCQTGALPVVISVEDSLFRRDAKHAVPVQTLRPKDKVTVDHCPSLGKYLLATLGKVLIPADLPTRVPKPKGTWRPSHPRRSNITGKVPVGSVSTTVVPS